MIKGLDNGYLYTKDNEKRIFKSAYRRVDNTLSDITIDGIDFGVGSGNPTIEVDKTDQEINKVCTLYNLKLTGPGEYYLVAGLPIGQYKLQREKFTKMIMGYNDCKVSVHEQDFKFHINDVLIFPQGAGALMSIGQLNGDYIVFDIGGLTIDIGLIEMINGSPVMQKYDTWYKGIQKLYSQIIHATNNRYNMTLEPRYAEKIFVNGLTIEGERQDLAFLQPVLQAYLEPILTEFQLNYPSKTTQIVLCGGGASVLYGVFKFRFKSVILLPDSQFANAMGYYKIGCRKFDKYISKGVRL
jgi:plasmid segregation protein ParM